MIVTRNVSKVSHKSTEIINDDCFYDFNEVIHVLSDRVRNMATWSASFLEVDLSKPVDALLKRAVKPAGAVSNIYITCEKIDDCSIMLETMDNAITCVVLDDKNKAIGQITSNCKTASDIKTTVQYSLDSTKNIAGIASALGRGIHTTAFNMKVGKPKSLTCINRQHVMDQFLSLYWN